MLLGEQVGIWKELVGIRGSSEQTEDLLEELADQVKGAMDSIELFTWGEHFLRVWEMGKPEGLEEVENFLRKHRRRLERKEAEKEKELGKKPEKEPEVVSEVDVEMTLH